MPAAVAGFTHLKLSDRIAIEQGIRAGSSKADIARSINKDSTTVAKEIKAHRFTAAESKLKLECDNYRGCPHGRDCTLDCPEYKPFYCIRRDRTPGACTGCSNRSRCRYDKIDYLAHRAQAEYEKTLSESREGANLTTSEARAIADIVGPLMKRGLSPYQIVAGHPALGISVRCLYNYIENDVLSVFDKDICPIKLRQQVRYRKRKSKSKPKSNEEEQQVNRSYLQGRTYDDYQAYMGDHCGASVVQMDTVYNDVTNGPFIQTFKFIACGVMIGIYHESKTAADMITGIDKLEEALGPDVFRKYVNVLLTDRGSEFTAAEAAETSIYGGQRTKIFYCDPMRSGQKGSLENNHHQLRYFCPKKANLRAMGLTSQDTVNEIMTNINSSKVPKLGGAAPLEVAKATCPDLFERLEAFGVRLIPQDSVLLKPQLLAPFREP